MKTSKPSWLVSALRFTLLIWIATAFPGSARAATIDLFSRLCCHIYEEQSSGGPYELCYLKFSGEVTLSNPSTSHLDGVECMSWVDVNGAVSLSQSSGYATAFFGDSSVGQYLYVRCSYDAGNQQSFLHLQNSSDPHVTTRDIAFYYDAQNERHDIAYGERDWIP